MTVSIYDFIYAFLSIVAGIITLEVATRAYLNYLEMPESPFKKFTHAMSLSLFFMGIFFLGRGIALVDGGQFSTIAYIFSAFGIFGFIYFYHVLHSAKRFLMMEGE